MRTENSISAINKIKDNQVYFLKLIKDETIDPSKIEELRDLLRYYERQYYVLSEPAIDDYAYDQLYKLLQRTELRYPELLDPASPTQRVGSNLNYDFPSVRHLVPMLSLENSYNDQDLREWNKRNRELLSKDIIYCLEPKFDGAGISLIYENDRLVRAATRGDGVEGEDITNNMKRIKSIPLKASFSEYGIQQIEIRGEMMMNKSAFKAFNMSLEEQGASPLANPRNAAAGSLRLKNADEISRRNLEAYLYHVSFLQALPGKENLIPKKHADMLKMLWDCGFKSPYNEKFIFTGIEAVIDQIRLSEESRDSLPFEIDGMVIKVNDLHDQDLLGMTSHHPRWAMAYKFKARQAETILKSVLYQVGRTGAVTPVAKLDPVSLGGVTISSISLHNEDYIKEKDLKLGDHVLIERAGDVIPQIVRCLNEKRTGSELPIQFVEECPICGSRLYREPGQSAWRCINIECKAQVLEKIIHFASKDAMDIQTLGESNIRKFYELGLITDIPSLYAINYEKLSLLEGFGKKSAQNLKRSLDQSQNQPLNRLIYGLGIRYVGETTAKTLSSAINTLWDLTNLTEDKLLALDDVGPKVAGSVLEFFHNVDNLNILRKLEALGLNFKNEKSALETSAISGKSFLFTGTLSSLKRNDAEAMVEGLGGKIASSVSSKLNYLVVGEKAGSKLEKAKKMDNIKILTEEQFIDFINDKNSPML